MKSQTIIGIIFMIVGFILTAIIIGAIWGIPLFLIGLFLVIFRNEESKIEQIKNENKGKGGGKRK